MSVAVTFHGFPLLGSALHTVVGEPHVRDQEQVLPEQPCDAFGGGEEIGKSLMGQRPGNGLLVIFGRIIRRPKITRPFPLRYAQENRFLGIINLSYPVGKETGI